MFNAHEEPAFALRKFSNEGAPYRVCLLYTSDAADDSLRVDLGGRRIIKKKNFQKGLYFPLSI